MVNVSVIVPVYNGSRTISPCLDSLLNQTYSSYELIIVDNGSTDGSLEKIEALISKHPEREIKLIHEKERGSSPARNRGIRESTGSIMVFTDSDCIADPLWLQDLTTAFYDPVIGAVAGNIRGYKPTTLIEHFLSLFTLRGSDTTKEHSAFTIFEGGFPTANLAVKKSVLDITGGFSGQIYGEDHDLCARVYAAGFHILYIPQGQIFHVHRNTLWGLIKQSFHFGKSHARSLTLLKRKTLILELPKKTVSVPFPFHVWINLNNADKKMFISAIPGFFYAPLFGLPLLFFCYLLYDMYNRCLKNNTPKDIRTIFCLTSLLLIKSVAMSGGKIYGSFKYRAVCV